MGNFSTEPETALLENLNKGYIGAHIEQGVPVLDRDLNLLADLVAETTRRIVTSYIGNGIPEGNNGFEIAAIPDANDFLIQGAGTVQNPGRCLVDGIEVRLPANLRYSEQTDVAPLTTPSTTRVDRVYLDVWLLEISTDGPGETDEDLMNAGDVGMRTSVRVRPEWRVRVQEGDPPFPQEPGHRYYELAEIRRVPSEPQIQSSMLTDLRHRRLSVAELARRMLRAEELSVQPSFLSSNAVTPGSGPVGTTVQLRGHNLYKPGLTVRFNSTEATVQSVNPDGLTVTVPTALPNNVNATVSVTHAGGSASLPNAFNVVAPPPTISGFNPTTAPLGGVVTIQGTNLGSNPKVTLLLVDPSRELSCTISSVSENLLVFEIPDRPEAIGTGRIRVETTSGVVETVVGSHPLLQIDEPPLITSIVPVIGGVGTEVTLEGSGLRLVTQVTFGSINASFRVSSDNTKIETEPPLALASGVHAVSVRSQLGTATAPDGFRYVP